MRAPIATFVAFAALATPAWAQDLMTRARQTFKPIPAQAPSLPGNPMTPEKLELGKMLFFDPRLSLSGLLSCNTCHNVGMGGVDGLETSIGHRWQKGPRNAPTVFNAVYNVAQFWDGRAATLREQAKGPLQASVEMNATPAFVEKVLASIPAYVALFHKAFPNDQAPVTFDNTARAVEVFESTLVTPGARFDRFLDGNADALSPKEKQGLRLFMDNGCSACHNGINVGGQAYYPFGVVERPGARILPPEDKGRFAVTKTVSDEYVFRAAPLRNIALTPPYFHSGKVWSLKQAVGVMGSAQLGKTLTEAETDDIVAFLGTLTGRTPKVEYPILPARSDTTPAPNPE